jgi:multiple sugar transport system permease protein
MSLRKQSGFPFIIPGMAWVIIFTLLPMIYLIYLSFSRTNLLTPSQFVGLSNYSKFFEDRIGLQALIQTLTFALGSTTMTLIAGTVAAWVFSYDLAGIRFLRTLFTTPLFAAPVALATMARIFFSPLVGPFVDRPILGDQSSALIALMVVDAWQWTPLVFVVVLNAIRNISAVEYESARLETKSEWAIFSFITYPRARSALLLIAILRLIESLRVFDIVLIATQGGPANATQTLMHLIYNVSFRFFDMGYASVLAIVLLVPTAVLIVIFVVRLRKQVVPVKTTTLLSWMESLRHYETSKR